MGCTMFLAVFLCIKGEDTGKVIMALQGSEAYNDLNIDINYSLQGVTNINLGGFE
jgi:hypothetical protein